MDLSILVEETRVYIRVAGIVRTPNGFIFEKSKDGYLFTLGGKIKLNETSREAIKREIMEEIGMQVEHLTLRSVIENLYKKGAEKVHEICFVYNVDDIFEATIPKGFLEVPMSDFNKFDIKPSSLVSILKDSKGTFEHIIQN